MTPQPDVKISPMMAQWHECKAAAPGALLLFRLGDFYEAFHEDAALLSKELEVTLTRRQEVPMAGIPAHTSQPAIDKLVSRGLRVAIAEQVEDPKLVKGLLKREVVRVLTPGTAGPLSAKSHTFLACVVQAGKTQGLAVLDVTTADFKVFEFDTTHELLDELMRLEPKEILLSKKGPYMQWVEEWSLQGILCLLKEPEAFDPIHACSVLTRHFHVQTLEGFGLQGKVAAMSGAAAILQYVKEELHLCVSHIQSLQVENLNRTLQIDRTTLRHLEIFSTYSQDKGAFTLLKVLDQTHTAMGGRLLKLWLMHPLLDVTEIQERQDAIAYLFQEVEKTEALRACLQPIYDVQRLMTRLETASASPRDLLLLSRSLAQVAALLLVLEGVEETHLRHLKEELKDVSSLVLLLEGALVEDPPLHVGEGGIFKEGFNAQLDELLRLKQESHLWVARYQTELKESTGIKTLKVGYTGAFGYYIEVSKGQRDKMPPFFERRQTLVSAERFTTPELKEFEFRMLNQEEQRIALERALFSTLRTQLLQEAASLHAMTRAIAQLDVLCSLSVVAKRAHYVRPTIDESSTFFIEQGRHPMIEAALGAHEYIPNDLFLDGKMEQLHLITGPNMAGKSTFIRQAALLAILAQIGSFVPAKRAHIGIVDKVLSRIGASDDLSKGHSTFMVEMTETAYILNHATSKSLVILDEIGRGTSTYDGIAIAWAVAQYLLTQSGKKAKTLFATHYWELTELEKCFPGAVNYTVAVHESSGGIVFLRKIVKGGTDKSYGLHVAALAGLPHACLHYAHKKLESLEKPQEKKGGRAEQLSLFSLHKSALESELKALNPLELTPLQALEKLIEWKKL